jgi:hypothetical protein
MDLKDDHAVLAVARRTAADDAWSDAVRGQALLLTAKVGDKDDLDEMYGYLDNPHPLLRTRALEAITALELKVAAAAPH